jgi:hypothetical protein
MTTPRAVMVGSAKTSAPTPMQYRKTNVDYRHVSVDAGGDVGKHLILRCQIEPPAPRFQI